MAENFELKPPTRDLLGDDWRPIKDRRGRKRLRILKQDVEKVEELVAAGMTQLDIATVMGVDVKTLAKYFSRQMEEGALVLKAEALAKLREKVRDGNVSAIKAMLALLDRNDLRPAARHAADPTERMGKKETLAKEAREPEKHGGWGQLLQ